jgi:hypothetical protein
MPVHGRLPGPDVVGQVIAPAAAETLRGVANPPTGRRATRGPGDERKSVAALAPMIVAFTGLSQEVAVAEHRAELQ